ncbi:Protein kinase-like (PK-like) [Glarea lozoyensis ATCC 20868]|uniref:Protein kinase-like (PK-like) n=1 Tax=Glarea lozoyensis (strain ATCC 20868 / MF5171) TaxID=1116229 RepID=S3CIF5_GLAL2|nr:Protein kinase-like (PK-like) [Glarea lozoyensis ATCC 20868]EPE25044.1 Protein kinase-like (PK-like) [Glarea lozoyensis ATCC 20868]
MDYRRTSLVVNRKQQAIANAHIYASFAGPAGTNNANGILAETPTMWWDEDRIETTVTRQFVLANLRPDEQLRLDEPLRFGEGLTDDTYMEWIESKAKRIFLILVDLGVPDQIFGVLDDSWDDDDLPVPLDHVERLRLTYEKDERMDKRFFQRQFVYLLRGLQKGAQLVYADDEVVPLELTEKRPVGAVPGLTQSNFDKVHLPGRPDDIFIRRKIPIGTTPGRLPMEDFLAGVESLKNVEHDHLTCLWASYTHLEHGYLIMNPVDNSSLKSFLTVTPQSYKILAKQERRIMMMNWMHCLADALSFLHSKGLSHRNIKPSNIMLDIDNHIFLSDCSIFNSSPMLNTKQGFDKETYDYSAPEKAARTEKAAPVYSPNTRSTTRGTMARRSTGPSTNGVPVSPTITTSATFFSDTASIRTSSTGSNPPSSPTKSSSRLESTHDPQKSDIFSLGTIFLEIITFLLKRASRNFASHRASKNKTPGRGGGLPDSSFHKNLGQVESWMSTLARDASKKEDQIFRGVSHILLLVNNMLSVHPDDRPTAKEVQESLYAILSEYSGMGQPKAGPPDENRGRIHCETRENKATEWNFGFDELRLASQRAAAAACASVAPVSTLIGNISSNTTVIYPTMNLEKLIADRTVLRSPAPRGRSDKDGDKSSIHTKNSKSSEGKSRAGSGNGGGKIKPKPKAWQAPVYAGGNDLGILSAERE